MAANITKREIIKPDRRIALSNLDKRIKAECDQASIAKEHITANKGTEEYTQVPPQGAISTICTLGNAMGLMSQFLK